MSYPPPPSDYTPVQAPGGYPGGAEPYTQPQPSAAHPPYQPPPAQYQPYQAPPGYPPRYPPGANPTNAFAIASLIVSIFGFSIIGVILGHIALAQINRSNGYEQGRGLALAGLIIGYAELAIGVLIALGILLFMATSAVSSPSN